MEKLLLRPLLAGHELNVVHQQHIDRTVLVAEARRLVKTDRVDQLIHESHGSDVADPRVRRRRFDSGPDSGHKVALTAANPAINEKWIVGRARRLGRRL